MNPSCQTSDTRLEPLTPAPLRTLIELASAPAAQLPRVLLLPTLNVKSAAVGVAGKPAMSIISPLMPRL